MGLSGPTIAGGKTRDSIALPASTKKSRLAVRRKGIGGERADNFEVHYVYWTAE